MTKEITVGPLTLGKGIPKICIPLTGKTREDLQEQCSRALASKADLVEWRMDLFQGSESIEEVLSFLKEQLKECPILFTIRTRNEGGEGDFSEEEYEKVLITAAGTEIPLLIDVEVLQQPEKKKLLIDKLHQNKIAVIASSHDFEKTEVKEQLIAKFAKMDESGADILKMAVMPQSFDDVAVLMQAVNETRRTITERPLIAMSMGQEGMISRIAGENYGSCLTFGTAGEASAPGQVEARALRSMMEALHRENNEETE